MTDVAFGYPWDRSDMMNRPQLGTCPKCGKPGLIADPSPIPIFGEIGTSLNAMVVRCNMGGCNAVAGVVMFDAPNFNRIAQKVDALTTKVDRLAAAMQSRGLI